MLHPLKIALTTGDPDGIGSEITAKALSKIKPQKQACFYMFRSPSCPAQHLDIVDTQFKRITVSSWQEALTVSPNHKVVIDIKSTLPSPVWVDLCARACNHGHLDGLATAPLSKIAIKNAGFSCIGHTEILQRATASKTLFMAFVGNKFSTLLATGHIPLNRVSENLDLNILTEAIQAANKLKDLLGKDSDLPIALVGLNPHAGEETLIGSEEKNLFASAISCARKNDISIDGPLVPDAAFFPENWKKYSIYISPYHDQGLIPFKMIHGQNSGVHITMGLPFIRTSVDHGTAKDIFNTNSANPNSMIEAIEWAINLTKKSKIKNKPVLLWNKLTTRSQL